MNPGKNIFSVLLIYYLYLIGTLHAVVTKPSLPLPVITILTSTSYDFNDANNVSLSNHDSKIAVIPSNVRTCLLICNASYPITWILSDQSRAADAWSLGFRTRRIATNIFDSNTFKYSAELNFYPHSESPWTGNYTCKSVVKEELQSSKYLFWEGTNALLHAYKNLTIFADEGTVVIPCIMTKRRVNLPTLQQRIGTGYQTLAVPSKNLSYDASKGFTLTNVTVGGNYKCIVNGKKDWINFEVKVFNETFIGSKNSNATFVYNPIKSELVCCSSTKRSPKLITYYCKHPSICNFKSLFTLPPSYYSHNKRSKRGCSKIKVYTHTNGIAHCLGDGIDTIKNYVFPMKYSNYWHPHNDSISAYLQWNEIPAQEMMIINFEYVPPRYSHYYDYGRRQSPTQIQSVEPMYEGEIINFQCEPSSYYFSEGVHWSIKFKNRSILLVNTSADSTEGNINYFHGSYSKTQVKLHIDMESIICIAPVWNSTEYVFKPMHIYVNASKPSIIKEDKIEESFVWIMNDTQKLIHCEAEGIPTPTFIWTKTIAKNGKEQSVPLNDNLGNITREVKNGTNKISETLVIHRVSYDTSGVYICTASNVGASVHRKITVIVQEPSSIKRTTAIIVGIVLVILLCTGLGLLFLKLRIDRNVIKELALPVGFNNANANANNQEGIVTDVDNTPYDIPKIHSNLLN